MNAAVDELAAVPTPEEAAPVLAPVPAVVLDESLIARAMSEADTSGKSAREILARLTGLSGSGYARALAAAFDYGSSLRMSSRAWSPTSPCSRPPKRLAGTV